MDMGINETMKEWAASQLPMHKVSHAYAQRTHIKRRKDADAERLG
jgi:hypothetical protein